MKYDFFLKDTAVFYEADSRIVEGSFGGTAIKASGVWCDFDSLPVRT